MIDNVQKKLESMAAELDSYYRRKVFTKKEIDTIILTRRKYENKINRTSKRLNDFIFYIESEKKLEKIRNKKISNLGSGFEESDLYLQKNIILIYSRAFHYFPNRRLLEDFSEYCVKKKLYEELKTVFSTICLKSVSDTDLWVYCAKKLWEIEDIDGSRSIFLKCCGFYQSFKVYFEFFKIECQYAQKINKINESLGVLEEDKDDIEKGDIALTVFKEIIGLPVKITHEMLEECYETSKAVAGLTDKMKTLISSSLN